MIQLFRKANDKAGAEVDPKDPTKQKWNADNVYVQVENEMVSLSDLAKHSKENDYEAVQSVENELEIDGSVHNVNDLITRYKASKAKKNDGEDGEDKADKGGKEAAKKNAEEEEKKKEEEAKNKKNADEEKEEEDKQAKKNTEEEEKKKEEEAKNKKNDEDGGKKKDEEDDVEGKIKKQSNSKDNGKDIKHFVRLNTARENGAGGGNNLTIDTMLNRIDRGKNRYGSSQ
jgi:flagellar biosynthesis GTPase FlhF